MHFALTEEQEELVAAVRGLVARRARVADPREIATSPDGFDTELWSQLCEQIGVAALSIPESDGGAGFSSFETHLVLEELGRTLTATPLLSSGVLAVQAVSRIGDAEARRRLLPDLAEGSRIGALSWPGSQGGDATDDIRAERNSDQWTLTGESPLVLGGDSANLLLVLAPIPEGTGLFEVDLTQPTVARITRNGMDQTMRFVSVSVDGASAVLLGVADDRQIADLHAVFAVATTALQVGGAQAALDDTVAYLKERVQFGRPIGSFQALKHRCADMMVAVETARSISWAAAWAAATDADELQAQAAAAASWCGEAFSHVAGEMVQLHGGIAITWEHAAHLYFKRAHLTAQLFGSPHEHRRTLVTAQ